MKSKEYRELNEAIDKIRRKKTWSIAEQNTWDVWHTHFIMSQPIFQNLSSGITNKMYRDMDGKVQEKK